MFLNLLQATVYIGNVVDIDTRLIQLISTHKSTFDVENQQQEEL